MKRLIFLIVVATLVLTASARAQLATGIGVSIGSNTGLLVPILFTHFRIEPILTFSYSESSPQHPLDSIYQYALSSSSIRGGLLIGLFYRMAVAKDFEAYFGPRIGASFTHATNQNLQYYSNGAYSYSSTTNSHILTGSLVLGGEYRLSEHFSLGVEAALTYSSSPATDYFSQTPSKSSPSNPSVTQSANLGTAAVARYYW